MPEASGGLGRPCPVKSRTTPAAGQGPGRSPPLGTSSGHSLLARPAPSPGFAGSSLPRHSPHFCAFHLPDNPLLPSRRKVCRCPQGGHRGLRHPRLPTRAGATGGEGN